MSLSRVRRPVAVGVVGVGREKGKKITAVLEQLTG
jgi:hypothetical protein